MKQQFAPGILPQCLFIAGPTASGKTDISLELAKLIGPMEIVSLDSMCLYRGMDIGTAKPDHEARAAMPHHLLDVIDPHEEYSVAEYLHAAQQACVEILARGARPVFVGGTGLYLRSVLRGVFEGPPADWSIRERLQKLADESAAKGDHYWLMRQLEKVDPEAALKLHPNDQRRLIRAIEVFELTGRPLSAQQNQPPLPVDQRPKHVLWLEPPRDWLHDRINRRVEQMMAAGLVEEVRDLLRLDPPLGQTAAQALGYKEVIEALNGQPDAALSHDQTAALVDLIQTRTRQFAKRQHTWFRNMEECQPLELSGEESSSEAAQRIARLMTGG